MRRMAGLACAAALLLIIAPTISRALSRADAPASAGWSAMCTPKGLSWVQAAIASGTSGKRAPTGMPAGDDCPYCPLAASLALSSMPPMPARQITCDACPGIRDAWTAQGRCLGGAGCRGPPALG